MFTLSEVDNDFISVAEAARRLGFTATYLYKLIGQDRIPTYTRGISERRLVKWSEIREKFAIRRADGEDVPPEDGDEGNAQA